MSISYHAGPVSTYPSLINYVSLLVKNTWAQTTETCREPDKYIIYIYIANLRQMLRILSCKSSFDKLQGLETMPYQVRWFSRRPSSPRWEHAHCHTYTDRHIIVSINPLTISATQLLTWYTIRHSWCCLSLLYAGAKYQY